MNPFQSNPGHPGIEFFQSLLKGSGMPSGFANWMAPTLDPEELERKIVELRSVLQWLEANVRLTQATIQALEVQRMTLSTLQTMNVDLGQFAGRMGDVMRAGAEAMAGAQPAAADTPAQADDRAERRAAAPPDQGPTRAEAGEQAAEPAPGDGARATIPGLIDPMQWWGVVSEQFGKLATEALRESPWPKMQPAAGRQAEAASGSGSGAEHAPAPRSRAAARSTSQPARKAPARPKAPAAAARKRPGRA